MQKQYLSKKYLSKNIKFCLPREQDIYDFANNLENFSGHIKRLLMNEMINQDTSIQNVVIDKGSAEDIIIKKTQHEPIILSQQDVIQTENIQVDNCDIKNILDI